MDLNVLGTLIVQVNLSVIIEYKDVFLNLILVILLHVVMAHFVWWTLMAMLFAGQNIIALAALCMTLLSIVYLEAQCTY